MTVLDSFVSFTNSLTADRRQSVEDGLAALMESYSDAYQFTSSELTEISNRLAEPKPEYSSPEAITRVFGKPFSA